MKTILSTLLLIASGTLWAEPIVDITQIAGKNKEEVSKILGEPTSSSKSTYGEKLKYAKGDTEIVFISGKADWITVEGLDNIPFNTSALESIGLKDRPPSFKNGFVFRWTNFPGIIEISIFQGTEKCDYAYIQVFTKAK